MKNPSLSAKIKGAVRYLLFIQKRLWNDFRGIFERFQGILSSLGPREAFSLLFFGSVLLGALFKWGIGGMFATGYDDFRVASDYETVSLNKTQDRVLREGGSLALNPKESSPLVCR